MQGYLSAEEFYIVLFQDFHQNKTAGHITGVSQKEQTITKNKIKRSTKITKLGSNPITLSESKYVSAIAIQNKKEKLATINTNALTSAEFEKYNQKLRMLRRWQRKKSYLRVCGGGGIFNAYSKQWDQNVIDQKGHELTDFLLLNTLFVQKPPGAPPHPHFAQSDTDKKSKVGEI